MFPLLAWATVTLVCGMLSLYLYRIEVILAINRILGRHKKPVAGIARPDTWDQYTKTEFPVCPYCGSKVEKQE